MNVQIDNWKFKHLELKIYFTSSEDDIIKCWVILLLEILKQQPNLFNTHFKILKL